MVRKVESLESFYKDKFDSLPAVAAHNMGQFNAFCIEDRIRTGVTSPAYIRRDFYKIMLFSGDNVFYYGDKSIAVSGNTLLFFNPATPYSYEPLAEDTQGFFCVFKDDFFKDATRINLTELPVFATGAQAVYRLPDEVYTEVRNVFEKIIKELSTDYVYKYELIRNYVGELIYSAMKLEPLSLPDKHINSNYRIATVFLKLLECQFPIDSIAQRFALRKPKDFAERISIHINSLNRAVKDVTGKTTTEHISERLAGEAKSLLKHTDWSISQISDVLGFEDQPHFNKFFKKHHLMTPSAFRVV